MSDNPYPGAWRSDEPLDDLVSGNTYLVWVKIETANFSEVYRYALAVYFHPSGWSLYEPIDAKVLYWIPLPEKP
jgi:hypothetical protein